MKSGNKNFMQTIFEVSIQQAAGYLVNCHCHLSIPIIIEFSKLYCHHMKQKFCHLLFILGNVKESLSTTMHLFTSYLQK